MSNRPTHKVEMAFGVGALGDTVSATTSGTTDTGNAITCPDAAPLRSSTLLDIRMKLSLSDWTPSAAQIIAQKDGGTNNRGWTLTVTTGGSLSFAWSDTSHTNALFSNASLAIPAFVDGSAHWLRVKASYRTGESPVGGITGVWLALYISENGNTWTPYNNVAGDYQVATASAPMNPCTGDLLLKASAHAACTVTFHSFELFTETDTKTSAARLDLDQIWAPTDTSWTSRRGNVWTAGAAITIGSLWTDVTADWRGSATVMPMGRASLLDAFNAGTMSFPLDNADRKYDRSNSAGPYFGQLVSRVPTRWRSQYAGIVYDLFRGVVSGGWGQTYDVGNHDATVAISATDPSTVLADASIPDNVVDPLMSVGQSEVGGLAGWWKLDSPTVWRDLSTGGRDLAVSGTPADADPLVYGSSAKARLMTDNCYGQRSQAPLTAYPLTVEFWFQTTAVAIFDGSVTTTVVPFVLLNSDGVPLLTIAVGNDGPSVTTSGFSAVCAESGGFSQCRILDGVAHHVAVVVTSSTATFYIDGIKFGGTVTVTGTPASLSSASGVRIGTLGSAYSATVDSVAVWSRAMALGEIAQHSSAGHYGRGVETARDRALFVLEGAGWPGHLVDLDANASTLCQPYVGGSAKALDYLRTVESTERGQLFIEGSGTVRLRGVASNFNDARSTTAQHMWAETDYQANGFGIQNDDDRIVNQSDVTAVDGAKSTAEDTPSVDQFGPKSFSVSDVLNTSDIETQAAAGYYVWLGKDQGDRVDNLPISPDDNPDVLYPLVLGAQVGDLQAVERTPQGVGSEITIDAHIEGVTYAIAPDFGNTLVSYALSNQQAKPGEVLIWDSWVWDDGKVWGP